jgi:Tfp pilus assembly PilM family ATPase
LSKTLIDRIVDVFQPQVPLWGCEFTSKHVIIAGVSKHRDKVAAKLASELGSQGVNGSLTDVNIPNREATRATVLEALSRAGFEGSEIVVIVPDDAVRIAFLHVEKLSKDPEEQQVFIRWKLKKTVPFDVESAQIAYRLLGTRSAAGADMLVTLSPRTVVEEYQSLFDSMDLHAGVVVPSTLAALNLFRAPSTDSLFLKIAPSCITTTIFQNGRMQFYRRVVDVSPYEAVHPTLMYYQDKLGGKALEQLIVCGYDSDIRPSIAELQEKFGLVPQRLEPKPIDDIFKPALGGVHCVAV